MCHIAFRFSIILYKISPSKSETRSNSSALYGLKCVLVLKIKTIFRRKSFPTFVPISICFSVSVVLLVNCNPNVTFISSYCPSLTRWVVYVSTSFSRSTNILSRRHNYIAKVFSPLKVSKF